MRIKLTRASLLPRELDPGEEGDEEGGVEGNAAVGLEYRA